MKKVVSLLLALMLVLACVGCGTKNESAPAEDAAANEQTDEGTEAAEPEAGADEDAAQPEADAEDENAEPETDADTAADDVKSEGVMTYDEYVAAELDTEVVVETYVQAKQSWWEDKATVYSQDKDGGYFLYNMACSEEDYEKLTPGTKIKVTGYKSEWSGEVEIIDATFEIEEGNYVAEAQDVTALLGKDELIDHQNKFVTFKGMTVEASKDADGNDVAFLYNWDGSGQDGDDLYFNVSLDGSTYTFTVESYLCDNTTDVYNAVKGLNIGDQVDMEGFLYWYEGVNPHITSVTVK
ncbi:hypothetical protein [Parablautia intestinalis]|jgi:hypothetical protein|uniref:hypothetical protein n=1 Tax=Parablautia intestinalis TaxID=2320100 RepID=UPI0023C04639|nr:hypothetical protein [Parablautia intestinalis]MCI8616020.1 hypothetical protein [Lachnospiraceae bacterium]MDE7047436.1 hypothetical protein [Lachnospiraceae bacterium]